MVIRLDKNPEMRFFLGGGGGGKKNPDPFRCKTHYYSSRLNVLCTLRFINVYRATTFDN